MTTKTQATADSVTSIVNNNLQDALTTIINKTVAGVDAASGFLQEQIPEVIHQLLVWKMVENLVYAVAYFGVVVLCVKVVGKVYIQQKKDQEDHFLTFLAALVLATPSILCSVGVFNGTLTALQIWIAPKVWLIEYTAKLVKG